MIQWLACNEPISENRVVIKCHSLAYISDNSALKSSQVTDRKLLVNDPIKQVKGCSIFKMTSSSLRIKLPHDPKGCLLVLMRTPLKINIQPITKNCKEISHLLWENFIIMRTLLGKISPNSKV